MTVHQSKKLLLIIAIAAISVNLRPAIAGVGPLIHEIRMDTGLSNTLLGLLTTLPVLAFGIFSVLTPLFTKRIGVEGTMGFALLLLTGGLLLRVVPSTAALFAGTIILGIGIALGNVLLPGIVKKKFPVRFGLVTGIYSALLGVGATIASGVSVPLSEQAGLGWRWALGVWALASFTAFLIWLPQLKQNIPVTAKRRLREALKHLSSSGLAWNVAVFVGLQSFTFYTIIAWMPEILIDRGMEPNRAGWMLAITQGTGVIGTLLIPALASKQKRQRLPIFLIVLFEMISLAGLMMPSLTLVPVWASLLGLCLGGSFGLALLFIVMRTRDTESANELSGMSQSVGYTLAATGPTLFGAIHDLADNWTIPIGFLILAAIIKMITGWFAGDDQFV